MSGKLSETERKRALFTPEKIADMLAKSRSAYRTPAMRVYFRPSATLKKLLNPDMKHPIRRPTRMI